MSRISSPLPLLVAVAIAALPLALASSAASAATGADGDITWSVEPAPTSDGVRRTFDYSVDPGTQIVDSVVVTNSGAEAAEFLIYATDAINVVDTGAFGLLERDDEPVDLGLWITPATDAITIEAGMQAVIPFNLLIPSDATPGEHVAGIVAAVITEGSSDGAAIELEQRVGARVYLTVSGEQKASVEIEGLGSGYTPQLNPFAAGDLNVSYTVRNSGNVRVDVQQAIVVTGPFGIELGRFEPDTVTELLPRQKVRVDADIPAVFALFAAWSTVTLTPAPLGSSAVVAEQDPEPTESATAIEPTPSPTADDSEAFVDASSVEYTPQEESTLAVAISYSLTAFVLVALALVYFVWRYVAGTRERMYLAIDEATEAARAHAAAEAREQEGR